MKKNKSRASSGMSQGKMNFINIHCICNTTCNLDLIDIYLCGCLEVSPYKCLWNVSVNYSDSPKFYIM